MTRRLTIELPDELEQHLLNEAQRLNTSLENVVVLSLARLTPRTQKENEITEIVQHIREAKTAGKLTTEIPATPIALHLMGVMKNSGLIADFQRYDNRATNPYIQIHLNPNDSTPASNIPNKADFPEDIASILQDLESEDPTVRVQALTALGERYSEPK
ncbi:30S ribosomal protein S8 [Lusitaniella coriacea]|uniref:30S ribosomal protein S8 n=1 Tax=Lusitaniella coriacea TaxID=1983105 RepID=UPI003CF23F9F